MSEQYIGELRLFGFNYPPQGWAFCNGQLLAIQQNAALYSLLGTFYGGNGTTNFALPDLRGRVPVHQGQGNGLSNYVIGQVGGLEAVTLTTAQMPAHGHALPGSTSEQTTDRVTSAAGLARGGAYTGAGDTNDVQVPTSAAGGNQPHTNVQPYVALSWCIALQGIYPSRN